MYREGYPPENQQMNHVQMSYDYRSPPLNSSGYKPNPSM